MYIALFPVQFLVFSRALTKLKIKESQSCLGGTTDSFTTFYFLFLVFFFVILFGKIGAMIFLGQSLVAITLLELVDYIEHYGLQREKLPNGNYSPVKPHHSWDTNYFLTNTSLFNLENTLTTTIRVPFPTSVYILPDANQYPFGYSLAIIVSLVPPLWRKIIHPRLN